MKDSQFKDPKPPKTVYEKERLYDREAKRMEIQHPFIWKYVVALEKRITFLEELLEIKPKPE